MARDFEDRLRQSLQARAQDVTPDPALYREVQSRIRRGRWLRVALAGAGAVAVVALAAVTVPSVLDRRVEFEPAPVATQPPSEEPIETAAPCSDDGDALVAVLARDGDLFAQCSSGDLEALAATDTGGAEDAPALSPDGALLAYEATQGHSARVEVFDLAAGKTVERIDGASSPAFSAAGHLAYIRLGDGAERPRLVVREGMVDVEQESVMVTDELPAGVVTRHLVWDATQTPRVLFWEARYEGTTVWGHDYVEGEPWTFEVDGEGSYAAPSLREEARLHLLRTCCVDVEGDTAGTVELGVLRLPETNATFEPIVTLPDDLDASGALSLVVAGTADVDSATGAWTSGGADAWLVGDGNRLYLVDEDGNTELVDVGITGVAFNPAVQLPASPDSGTEEPGAVAQVDVHFTQDGGECGEAVAAHQRSVPGPGVLRGALTQLLAGPTPDDIAAGAAEEGGFGGDTAGYLNDVAIDAEGVARVDFDARLAEHFPSSACGSGALLSMLDPTVRQFPSVTEVVYSFDGSVDAFYNHFQLASPSEGPRIPRAVARTAVRIRDAAAARDYDALAELADQEYLSCSFSDQNEDCIAVWQEQEQRGEDPLGVMVEVLEGEPAKNPRAPIWAWPVEYIESDQYLGPRLGIDRQGRWRFFVQGGD